MHAVENKAAHPGTEPQYKLVKILKIRHHYSWYQDHECININSYSTFSDSNRSDEQLANLQVPA